MADVHESPSTLVGPEGRVRGTRIRLADSMATERFRWWLVFVVLVVFAAVRAATSMERDPYWSARAGLENLDGAPLVRPDSWSWSAEGVWYPNSPGWNLVLGLGWRGLGFWGLFAVALLAISLLLGLALIITRLAGGRPLPALVGFVPALLLASSGLSPRATVIVQCLIFGAVVFAWWWGGVVARVPLVVACTVPAVAGLVVSLLGNWVHLSFMAMSAAIAVMWALAWWASPGIRLGGRLALLGSGTIGLLLGCVLSPYGIAATLERSRIVETVCRGLVSEWLSVVDFARNGDVHVILVAAVTLAVALSSAFFVLRLVRRHGRFDPRVRLVLPLAVFGFLAVVVGLGTVRFISVGLLALLPVAGAAATWLVDRFRRHQRRSGGFWSRPKVVQYTSGRFLTAILLIVGLVVSPVALWRISQGARPPEAAVVELLPDGCLVWAKAGTSAPVILMRPDAKVWIDGRVDFYGRDHVLEYLRILAAEDPLPDEAGCVILPSAPGERHPLADALDEDSAWTQVADVDGYSLWVRD